MLVKLVGLTFLIKYQCFFVRSSIAQIFASFRKPKIIRSAFRPSQLLSIGRSLWKDPICWWSWAHLGEVFFFFILLIKLRYFIMMTLSPHLQIQNNIFFARFVLFLTCVSDKLRCLASSLRSAPTTYWFFSKACSNFNSWLGLKAVRILFGLRKGSKNSGKWGPEKRNIDMQLER